MAEEPMNIDPAPQDSVFVAYARILTESAQKDEIIKGLYQEIGRAKVFHQRDSHDAEVQALRQHINVRDKEITHLNNKITVLQAENGKEGNK